MEAIVQRLEARLIRRHTDSSALPPAPDLPPGSDVIPQIRHLVVLMMENHSFDNYLGVLGRGDGLPRNANGELTASNPTVAGPPVPVRRLRTTIQPAGVPTQSWQDSHEQWAGGNNDGFVRNAEHRHAHDRSVPMGYWTEEDLPFYSGLARVFPLADRWFSSCIGPTFPNRRFLVAGTAHGLTSDRISRTFDRPGNGTIFELLTAHGISWANYHPISHRRPILKRLLGMHGLRATRRAHHTLKQLKARFRRVEQGARSHLQFTADAYPFGLLGYLGHIRSIERFMADAAAGTLPAVSVVDPDYSKTSEENPQDTRQGEAFAARIINAVMHGDGWPHTLLIWVYDEHGGYYDHVPPPEAVEPDDHPPDEGGPWRFDRYGFRVPAVMVSPYARRDYVSHVVHDHTSILKFIETKWNLPPLTRRDGSADNLLDSLDFANPPPFADPPTLPRPALGAL